VRDLRSKTTIVTGAASGIGRALAIRLAEEGARGILVDLNEQGLEETRQRVEEAEGEANPYRVDVSDRRAVEEFGEAVIRDHGAVDILINNAGVLLADASVEATRYEDLSWILDTNLWGTIHMTKTFLPHLRTRPEAHIVNMSSMLGLMAYPLQAGYCTTKFAVRGFTETLRLELADTDVRVTLVLPGGVRTNLVRNARGVEPGQRENEERAFESVARTIPERAADQIVKGITRNKPRLLIGRDARRVDRLVRWLPGGYDRLILAKRRHSGQQRGSGPDSTPGKGDPA
jgi:NAD(P)-dependent dehydrogenase (short-subunit alcohol dehydrogenase family)